MVTETTPESEGGQGEPIGTVGLIIGTVQAQSPDSTIRILHVNAPVFLNDLIITGQEGMVSIAFSDGTGHMELGRMAEVLLDGDVLQAGAPENMGDSELTVEEMQQALLVGNFDPTAELAPAASGATRGAGDNEDAGGGHTPFVVELTAEEKLPENQGAETDGPGFSFRDPQAGPGQQPVEETVVLAAAPVIVRGRQSDPLELEGEAFGFSSFVSNFPIADYFLQNTEVLAEFTAMIMGKNGMADPPSAAELLESLLAQVGIQSEGLGVGEPDYQLVANIPNGSSATGVESTGSAGTFEIRDGQLYFKPNESFEEESQLSFTLFYDNGDSQQGTIIITERYLKVGSMMNDIDDQEFGEGGASPGNFGLPSLGYVVGDGQGAIEGGEAGDILIGDSFNIGPILEMMGPEGEWMVANVLSSMGGDLISPGDLEVALQNDQIIGNGGDDLIIGDSLNTTMLNLGVFQSIFNFAVEGEAEFLGELPPELEELNLGWYAFTVLEIFDDNWDRNDTLDFILNPDNREGLVAESSASVGVGEFFEGYGGSDILIGADGNDEIYGQGGYDYIDGWVGDDTLAGGSGNDLILGWTGNDIILGGSGNDDIFGEEGNDIVIGGEGADILVGGTGDDILVGDDAVLDNGSILLVEDGATDIIVSGEGNDTAGDATVPGPAENYIDVVENGPINDINGVDDIENLVPVLAVV